MKNDKKSNIKILIVGAGVYPIYETAIYKALIELGYKNTCLYTYKSYYEKTGRIGKFVSRIEKNITFGGITARINKDLLAKAKEMQPDLIFLYSSRAIYPETSKKLKENCKNLMVYCNDDPWSDFYPKYFWRHFRGSVKYADRVYVYRLENKELLEGKGIDKVSLLRSYYISDRNFYIENIEAADANMPRIGFIGHYEDDGRYEYIKILLDNDIRVAVNDSWKVLNDERLYIASTQMDEYNKIINQLDIAIVFLSKINHDTYTRRCFEIPATKTMMLCEYTEDLATMFKVDEEIVFFKEKEEFLNKARYYLDNPIEAKNIGQKGYERLMKDGHEAKDRAEQILNDYYRIAERTAR